MQNSSMTKIIGTTLACLLATSAVFGMDGQARKRRCRDMYQQTWELERQTHMTHDAAARGDTEVLKTLLRQKKPTPPWVTANLVHNWRTPLHCAAHAGHYDVALLLLQAGAYEDAVDHPKNQTPLHMAAAKSHKKIVRLLLHRANPNAIDSTGLTPLHLVSKADSFNRTQLKIARLLIQAGANVNAADQKGNTPLHCLTGQISDEAKTAVTELMAAGADPNIVNNDGDTPLINGGYLARSNGVAALLVANRKLNLETTNKEGATVLSIAAGNYDDTIARLMIAAGAQVATVDHDRWTPLHYAANRGAITIASLLPTIGADLEARSTNLHTPLHLAVLGEEAETGASPIVVRTLIKAGAYLEAADADNNTPLHLAVNGVDTDEGDEIARQLLAAGADLGNPQPRWMR